MKNKKNIPNYNVPEGYFEAFEERLFSKMAEENLPKAGGFKTPEDYFEKLETRVLKEVTASKTPNKAISLFPRKYFGYAAAIAAILVIGFLLFNTKNNSTQLDAPQLATLDTYIDEGYLDLDLYELTSYIDDEDLANTTPGDPQLSESALEDYLLNTLDTETLINQQ